jgi:DNA-directed RNA polymerase subunit H
MVELLKHVLVPKHEIVSKEEEHGLFESLKIAQDKLPKILTSDPIVKMLAAKAGDVIKITRNSPTSGESVYYRIVVED